ncbi:MAG: glycosyltransferase family 2 protein [Candidatus Jordarchaeum sp.]|uniref:glycosyltransferase family 2 protein n=1 Tax=Candidatus Jordarchaeum sp. TaxID=2823881 RepID=UPI00404A0298
MALSVSVILCAFNRKNDVTECLESILEQNYPNFDVWVVDDASTDGTYEFLKKRFGKNKKFHLIRNETEMGNTSSRNMVMRKSKGEIIVSTDDDCIVHQNWIANLVKTFEESDRIGLVTGRVLPIFYGKVPKWLEPPIYPILAIRTENQRAESLNPYGCNMAVRRNVMEKIHFLNEDITRKYGGLYSGEDTDLGLRVRAAGYRVVYTPDAVVDHKMFPERTSKEHFIRRALYFGMSEEVYAGSNMWKLLDGAANIIIFLFKFIIRPKFSTLTLIAYKTGFMIKALGGGEENLERWRKIFMRLAQKPQ